jgi:hypothetical protein
MSKTNSTASRVNEHGLNREAWLTAFAEAIAPIIEQRTGHKVPLSTTRLSCSFPRTRATPNRKTGAFTIGQCLMGHKSGLNEIMINPLRDVVIDDEGHGIAETITHELLHAALPIKTGHKAPFAKAAKAMGMEGKPTSTNAGPELVALFRKIAEPLGAYPHQAIDGEFGKKQSTRLLKVQCTDCGYVNEAGNGYTARITMTWIENAGLPTCPCGAVMDLINADEDDKVLFALTPVESSATYRVPTEDGDGFDDRFQIRRTSSEHFGERWTVIDFGERTVQDMFSDADARIVAVDSKINAIEVIGAVREGLMTWDEFETDLSDDLDDDEDDGRNPLLDDELTPEDIEAINYVEDDEDETPDYPEDAEPETEWIRVHPTTKREFVHSFDHDTEAQRRDEAGTRKSASIASGAQAAMD